MKLKSIVLVASAVLATGCWHIQVTTNAAPSPTIVDKPWQASFIYGLIPPSEVNVKDQCTNGVQKVETLMSPMNVAAYVIASALTFGIAGAIWQPAEVKVTCAGR